MLPIPPSTRTWNVGWWNVDELHHRKVIRLEFPSGKNPHSIPTILGFFNKEGLFCLDQHVFCFSFRLSSRVFFQQICFPNRPPQIRLDLKSGNEIRNEMSQVGPRDVSVWSWDHLLQRNLPTARASANFVFRNGLANPNRSSRPVDRHEVFVVLFVLAVGLVHQKNEGSTENQRKIT